MNTLRAGLEEGKKLFGTVLHIPSPVVVELFAIAGYDFVVVDLEHGSIGFREAEDLIRAAEACGIGTSIRVGRGDRNQINRALDTGAEGLWFPVIESAAEARQLVAWSKPPPEGLRGACPETRSGRYFSSGMEGYLEAARDVVLTMMIESPAGVEAINEISCIPGVDLLMVGPLDLSASLGTTPDDHRINEARLCAIRAAQENGIDVIESVFDAESIQTWSAHGSRIFSDAVDTVIFQRSLASRVQSFKQS